MRRITLALLLLLAAAAPALAAGPSFDCRKAHEPDEKAICGDWRLSQLDRDAARAYGALSATQKKDIEPDAADVLAARKACGAQKLCILDQQVRAIEIYDDPGPKVPVPAWVGRYRLELFRHSGQQAGSALPTQVGHCGVSRIVSIGPRLEGGVFKPPAPGDFDPGTSIRYADGGVGVSYSYERAIGASRIGDKVLVCLVSTPKNCPPGDDRGKFYSGTNFRTLGSWELPDSQHMCGGA